MVVLFAFALLISAVLLQTMQAQSSGISVGVKVGDWIEYNISTTGTPISGHDITYARFEIIEIQGTAIKANVTSIADNGTVSTIIRNFNLADGNIQAWVLIPANLGPGDSFYDASIGANVTIQGEQQKTFAGATRAITYVNTTTRDKQWDKATGMFVTTQDYLENYTVSATATATNMWSPQILGLDQTVFYIVVGAVAAIVIAAAVGTSVVVRRRKKIIKKIAQPNITNYLSLSINDGNKKLWSNS